MLEDCGDPGGWIFLPTLCQIETEATHFYFDHDKFFLVNFTVKSATQHNKFNHDRSNDELPLFESNGGQEGRSDNLRTSVPLQWPPPGSPPSLPSSLPLPPPFSFPLSDFPSPCSSSHPGASATV